MLGEQLEIRGSSSRDRHEIELLYPQAFPDEDLVPVVRELLPDTTVTTSIIAVKDDLIVGNVIFTKCGVKDGGISVALLAPLAVRPDFQRQGIGGALVRAGLQQMKNNGVDLVCVLGDPAYYGRLGFEQESALAAPFPLPVEWASAWQSQTPGEDVAPYSGRLQVPEQWNRRELWSP